LVENALYYNNIKGEGPLALLVIPQQWKERIMQELHDDPTGAHLGQDKTYNKVRLRYYWPKMKEEIQEFIRSCGDCQSAKVPRIKPAGMMSFIEVPCNPFDRLQLDFMGPIHKTSRGNKYILTAVDYLSKWIIAKPVRDCTAATAAKFMVSEVLTKFGYPEIVQSDRGKHFVADTFHEALKLMGSRQILSSPYHPQSQGTVEKSHDVIKDCIRQYVSADQKDWDVHLGCITYALNTSKHTTTNHSPFYILYGMEGRYPLERELPLINDGYNHDLHENLMRARQLAKASIEAAQQRWAKRYDETRRIASFAPGELVMMRKHVIKKGLSSKLFSPYYGPFEVIEALQNNTYRVQIRKGRKIEETVVNIDKLKPYFSRDKYLFYNPENDASLLPASQMDIGDEVSERGSEQTEDEEEEEEEEEATAPPSPPLSPPFALSTPSSFQFNPEAQVFASQEVNTELVYPAEDTPENLTDGEDDPALKSAYENLTPNDDMLQQSPRREVIQPPPARKRGRPKKDPNAPKSIPTQLSLSPTKHNLRSRKVNTVHVGNNNDSGNESDYFGNLTFTNSSMRHEDGKPYYYFPDK
jgi:hypothetical protein